MGMCPFCRIVKEPWTADIVHRSFSNLILKPLNPVVSGHLLVIPKLHAMDAYTNPSISAHAFEEATAWAKQEAVTDPRYASVNLITSVGEPATQSVFHLHIHIVPRLYGDGLALPWTGQEK